MFTHLLEREERIAILRLLGNLAESDDHVSESEVAHLKAVAAEMELDIKEVFRGVDRMNLAQICEPLTRYPAKVIAIMELVQLAFADRLVIDVERFKVRAIGEILGLEPDNVESIEDWVVRGRQWQAQGRRLLEPRGYLRSSVDEA